jgi:hypothetical protein
MDRIPNRLAAQGVKVETRQIYVFRHVGLVEGVQPAQTSILQSRANLGGSASQEKLLQPFVPKAFDHRQSVVNAATDVKQYATGGYRGAR